MGITDLGPLPLSILVSVVVAVALLLMRVFVMHRVQQQRQRENRQETERLKSLVAAYRSLAGSFTPALEEQRMQIEETLSDIVLFGSIRQVELAAACARALTRGDPVSYQALIEDLRSELRTQLGLEAIPASLSLPPSGPGRPREGREGRGEGGGSGGRGGGGGGAGGGGGSGAGVAGGVGAGLIAGEAMDTRAS